MEAKSTGQSGKQTRLDVDDHVDDSPGKIQRLSRETRGLVDDVKSWVELRMTLTQMDVEDRIDARINRAITGATVAAIGLLGVAFALVAAALALGSWLGHTGWGFLVVAGVLLLITGLLAAAKPRFFSVSSNNSKPTRNNG